jgi:ferritin
VYRCRGGRAALGAVEPKFWERFCRAIGREDLIPRQLDPTAREEVEKVLSEMDCNTLEDLAKREEIPLTPVYDIDKALTIFELDNLFKLYLNL